MLPLPANETACLLGVGADAGADAGANAGAGAGASGGGHVRGGRAGGLGETIDLGVLPG